MSVVDSSAVVAVLTGDLEVDDLGPGVLDAPDLIESEVLNALRGLWLGGELDGDDANQCFAAFDALSIRKHSPQSLRRRVWELRYNLTAYDATYVALAEQLDIALLTADAAIAQAPGIRCPVEVL